MAKKKPFTKREDPAETGQFGRPAPKGKKPVAKKRPSPGMNKKKGC